MKEKTLTERTVATREEMSNARLPIAYRDSCAHLLIPLNRCRYEEYYLPWKCEVDQTHTHPLSIVQLSNVKARRDTDDYDRTNDTATRNASTRSSRSE